MEQEARILQEVDRGVATLRINRPRVLNALNRETLGELETVLDRVRRDQEVKSVIITGSGEKAFVAGADIAELAHLSPGEAREYSLRGQSLFDQIEAFPKPVIAAINGFCLGGGCELAMACHMRIASENARFGQPEVKLGLIPGFGGTQRLRRLVGMGKALELVLSGKIIEAAEAAQIGLVNRVVAAEALQEACFELASVIASNAPLAVQYGLETVCSAAGMELKEGLRLEAALFGLCAATQDMREGTQAFLEKRRAEFKGK